MTELQRLELAALTGDRQAVIEVVSCLREYRQLGEILMDASRWGDQGRIFYFESGPDPRNLIVSIENLEHDMPIKEIQ